MRKTFTAVLACLMCATAPAKSPAADQPGPFTPRQLTAPGVQAFAYTSKTMGRDYAVTVRFPRQYREDPERRYPTLLITDANLFFAAASHALNAVEPELEKPMILVALGTPPEAGFMGHQQRRVHEFSPPDWDLADPFGQTVANSCTGWNIEVEDCVGGAPAYLRFITDELLPDLEQAFRIDTAELTLGGVSAGGFFAAWAMFQDGVPFRNYLISSPAMAYGDGAVFALEAAYAAVNEDFEAGIYVASGGREIDDPFIEGVGKIVSGQAQFGAVLRSRGYAGLRLKSESHPGLGHIDVVPVSYTQGLRFLFGRQAAAGGQP